MKNNLDLEKALSALDDYGFEQKQSASLEAARNKSQMQKYLKTLNYSLKRLEVLQEAVTELVTKEKEQQKKKELIQTYKTKVFNLSREYNLSYDEVIEIMANQA
ncbi:hypothetical protein JQC92_20465 [Shewanella sp. 202IG2-18]|uniref:hypothetical protein n=1 Tax=Parashewanella hymeniacidonis TaxID=2807618 RepID=UPI00195FAB8F|nr:hypothetical protein [Parashewanella hymeniacidonis]MBM7074368.1 hypothetical protein [Parashewanella hymeniacidonis]